MIQERYDKWLELQNWLSHCSNAIMEDFYYHAEIEYISEIIKHKLYFATTHGESMKTLKNTQDAFYFTTDEELMYLNYYYDFGPLNISCLYKFCCKINAYLCSPNIKRVIYYTSGDPNKRANAAFLIGSFAIIYLDISPRRIHQNLVMVGGPYRNFVDASQGVSNYTLRLLDCFQAIEKARSFNFFDFNDFNVMEYDMYDRIQNGDMNWLVPRRFLAFIGPIECEFLNGHPPEFYLKYFLKNDIKTVVRLNNKVYNSAAFADAGIEHHDLFFADGTTPPKNVLIRFLEIAERSPAAIAVHCKAGLGRTGSLIGAYIIKHYKMSARETIAWMRICRPGSVIGQQQGWLEKIENWLWKQGSQYRLEHFGEGDKIPHHRYGIYSQVWPVERKRLILQAHKASEARRLSSKSRSPSPHRLSVGRNKHGSADTSKSERSESERRKSAPDKEKDYPNIDTITKLISKIQDLSDPGNENLKHSGAEKTINSIEIEDDGQHEHVRKRFKELGNVHNYRRRFRSKDKSDADKTQGDLLNEIKLRKYFVSKNSHKEEGKLRPRKSKDYQDLQYRQGMQGDEVKLDKKNCIKSEYYIQDMYGPSSVLQNSVRKKIDDVKLQHRLLENLSM